MNIEFLFSSLNSRLKRCIDIELNNEISEENFQDFYDNIVPLYYENFISNNEINDIIFLFKTVSQLITLLKLKIKSYTEILYFCASYYYQNEGYKEIIQYLKNYKGFIENITNDEETIENILIISLKYNLITILNIIKKSNVETYSYILKNIFMKLDPEDHFFIKRNIKNNYKCNYSNLSPVKLCKYYNR